VNLLRRLSLLRLTLLLGLVIAIGVGATAIALALGTGPTPPPKPLAQAIHDALGGPSVQGFSAEVQLTDHLLEGANLASGGEGGELSSSPLLTGASGRIWVSADGRVRLELQDEKGDTQVLLDGSMLEIYDAAENSLYRVHLPAHDGSDEGSGAAEQHQPPTVGKIEEALARLDRNAIVSGATPTDVGGQPAYTVRVSPREPGSLIGGAELSFDAAHGLPLRAAIYSSAESQPVIELAASNVSYAAVPASVFQIQPPSDVHVHEVRVSGSHEHSSAQSTGDGGHHVTVHGHGPSAVAVLEDPHPGSGKPPLPGDLPHVTIGSATGVELRTALGTLLTFEREGVRYVVAGAVSPGAVEAVARGL
jgi:outer membrane lipoprotein-sorting protein